MQQSDVCVLLPTRARPEWFERVIRSICLTSPAVQIMAAIDRNDTPSVQVAEKKNVPYIEIQPNMGCTYAWNEALRAAPNYQAYILGADDAVFGDGWYEEAIKALDEIGGSGLVGFNDMKNKNRRPFNAFYMMTRDFIIKHHGGVAAIPFYGAGYVDVEACERARMVGKYIYAEKAVVKHLWFGGKYDDTYARAESRYRLAEKVYKSRRAEKFPDNFEAIICE